MKYIILLVLLLGSFIVLTQQIQIVDEKKRPLELVELRSKEKQVQLFTNSEGIVEIATLKGAQDIQILAYSYQTATFTYAALAARGFDAPVVLLEEDVLTHDEFVVSATRWKQAKKNIPNKITGISSKDVALQNPQTAADLLATSGEVFIQKSQQGGGSPMIRGFATNRLLYTVDGVRMNNAIFRGGNIQNVISLDPFTMENTEIFFGPGSVVYGSDAIGGVMSFNTLTPEFAKDSTILVSGSGATRYSSANNELTGHAHINLGWENFASITSFSYNNYGDLRMGSHGPSDYLKPFVVERVDSVDVVQNNPNPQVQNPSGYSQFNIMQKIRYKPNKNLELSYSFHFSETSEYARFDRLMELNNNGIPRSAVWKYGPQKWMMNNLQMSHEGNTFFYDYLSVRLAQQYFEESRIDRRLNHYRLRTRLEEVDAYSLNIDFEKNADRHQFFYGIEGVRNDVNSTGAAIDIRDNSSITVSNRYPQANWNTFSGYFNYQYAITEKLRLQAGARFSQFMINADFSEHLALFDFDFTSSSINKNAVNGSIGMVYNPTKKWRMSVNASTGFRAPNVDDIGKVFDFQVGDVTVPNTDLNAEYAYNIEGTISKIFGKLMKIDLTGFYTYLDNAIVRRKFQVAGQDSILYDGVMSQVFALQNAGFADVYGFNTNIEMRLAKGLKLSSRFNYQIGVEEMEDGSTTRSRHAAPWFGVTRLTYSTKKLDLQFYGMYSGAISAEKLNEEERQKPFLYAKDENGALYSPSWYTLNFKVLYAVSDHLSFSGGIENITNQRYRTYSSGLAAPGRNVIFSLVVNF